jgi:hypothetical protein
VGSRPALQRREHWVRLCAGDERYLWGFGEGRDEGTKWYNEPEVESW